MLLTGEIISAKEAQTFGLINKIFKENELSNATLNLAEKISTKSTQSITIGKKAFYKQLEMPLKEAYNYTSEIMTSNMAKKDAKEGIKAFMEKRNPKWT